MNETETSNDWQPFCPRQKEIEAIQWQGDHLERIVSRLEAVGQAFQVEWDGQKETPLFLQFDDEEWEVEKGDWLSLGDQNYLLLWSDEAFVREHGPLPQEE